MNKISHLSHYRRIKKRKSLLQNCIFFICIGFLLFFAAIAANAVSRPKSSDLTMSPSPPPDALPAAATLDADFTVDGVSLRGLSCEEASERLLSHYNWSIAVVLPDHSIYQVRNLLEAPLETLLQELYASGQPGDYSPDLSNLDTAIREEIQTIARQWDSPPHSSEIIGFNAADSTFSYSREQQGLSINRQDLFTKLADCIKNNVYQAELSPEIIETAPEYTMAEAKKAYQVIGTCTTNTTANPARNTNIQIAVEAINGILIEPGQEFSFNQTTGNRTMEKGYQPAGAYQNGILIEEPGGGVCQVSSTLYNAVVFSGLTTTERHAHSYAPSYVTPGEDAMVSYDGFQGPDMKFKNNSKSTVAIRARLEDRKLSVSIIGIPLLAEGTTISMHSLKVHDSEPLPATYIDDDTLLPGTESVRIPAVNGSMWITNLIVKENGTIVSDTYLHRSIYQGKAATIARYPQAAEQTLPEKDNQTGRSNETKPAAPTAGAGNQRPAESSLPETTGVVIPPEPAEKPKAAETTASPETAAAAESSETTGETATEPSDNVIPPFPDETATTPAGPLPGSQGGPGVIFED